LFTVQHQLDYFGTVRGRFGTVANNVLYYVTGGAAFAHVRQTTDVNGSATGIFVTGTTAADMFGWVAGAGIEAPLWGGWTGKAEYLYMDLGNTSMTVNISAPGVPATLTTNSSIRDHIVRVGTNYHF
jgi:outer membrane immunogenic protein